jgi:ATP-dependent RNA helicase DHX57
VTQPRRVAATSLAHRVASEMSSSAPDQENSLVGYHVRLDRQISDTAQIIYCTVGILLRMLICPNEESTKEQRELSGNLPLTGASYIIVDEVHERDLDTDFLLTLLRKKLAKNKHLRVIIMSATASVERFVDYFARISTQKYPALVTIKERSFPIETKWLADCERFAGCKVGQTKIFVPHEVAGTTSPTAISKIDHFLIMRLIEAIVQKQQHDGQLLITAGVEERSGAILVFLPGKAEIDALALTLSKKSHKLRIVKNCKLIIKGAAQQVVFKPAKEGTVKIVLATSKLGLLDGCTVLSSSE